VVSIVDGAGVIRFESPSIEAVLGYAPGERLGSPAFDFIHPDERDSMMKLFESVLSVPNTTLRAECRVRHADGSWRVVESVVQNLLGDAHIAGLIVHSRDVTDRKRTEDALRESEERQRQLAGHLAEVQRQKDQLLALIVHDFKNPLSAVLTNASYLVDGTKLDPETREVVTDIHESAQTLQRMVADLLDLGRSEDGALKLRTSKFDVGELADVVAHSIQPQATGRGQRVSVEVPPGTSIVADRELVRRVLENLLVNSVKYAPRDGVIELTACAFGASGVRIRVADHGPGIPVSDRERIFEMYGRLERDAAQARTSHGLGLAFCKIAAEAHGGRIWVDDNTPRGTCFWVELPDR
jgi:two-component system, sensor histidine kinase and response regulator